MSLARYAVLSVAALMLAAGGARAELRDVILFPVADNLMLLDSQDSSKETTVYQQAEVGVGCEYGVRQEQPVSIDTFVCASSALKFDLPAGVAGSPIVSAKLLLTVWFLPADPNTSYRLAVFAQGWSPNSLVYADLPFLLFYTAAGLDFAPFATQAVPWEIGVTQTVRNWADGSWANNGFLLEPANPLEGLGQIVDHSMAFYSSDPGFHGGSEDRPQLVIRYDAPDPPVITFFLDPPAISPGGTSFIDVSATNATRCALSGEFFNFTPPVRWPLSPATTTSYTLSCTGPGGASFELVTLTVLNPPILSLIANTYEIDYGDSALLMWTSSGALGCDFFRVGVGLAQTVAPSGTARVFPDVTATYRVRCQNLQGTTSDDATIVVPEPATGLLQLAAFASAALLARGRRNRARRRLPNVAS